MRFQIVLLSGVLLKLFFYVLLALFVALLALPIAPETAFFGGLIAFFMQVLMPMAVC